MTRSNDARHGAESRSGSLLLLVDDEIAFLAAMERLLRRHGFRAVSVTRGELALRALELWPISAVIADYRMPEMDGLELLEKVNPRLPRVLLTGDPYAVAQECERQGIVVIDKTNTISGLLALLGGSRKPRGPFDAA